MSTHVLRRVSTFGAVFVLFAASLPLVAHAEDRGATVSGNEIYATVTGSPIADISTSPLNLTPAFGRGIVDYVWRCQSGSNALKVTLTAIRGGVLHVGDQRGSTVTLSENLLENQALVITGPWSRGFAEASRVSHSDEERTDEARGHTQYWIRCLPHDFPRIAVTADKGAPEGWYVTGNINANAGSGTYAMVLDNHGTPVWYRIPASPHPFNVTLLAGGRLAWMSTDLNVGFGSDPDGGYEIFDTRSGQTTSLRAPVPPTDFHELHPLADGTVMMLSSPIRFGMDLSSLGVRASAPIVDCVMQQVDPSGRLLWLWRASDHIAPSESTIVPAVAAILHGVAVYDIYHCNSIDVDSVTGNILLSSRHTSAVYLISRQTGTVIWKLGGMPVSSGGGEVIRVSGDPYGTFHFQHDARLQPNGDVSMFDNESAQAAPARAVEYHLDLQRDTATPVWSLVASDGRNSPATGSFRRLADGSDNVVGWGIRPSVFMTETDQVGNLLLEVGFPDGQFAYRVVKVPGNALSHEALRMTAGT